MLTIRFTNRIALPFNTFAGVQGEDGVTLITFDLPTDTQDDVHLPGLRPSLKLQYPNGVRTLDSIILPDATPSTDDPARCQISWMVPGKALQWSGDVMTTLEFYDSSNQAVWRTERFMLKVVPAVMADQPIADTYPTQLQQMQDALDGQDATVTALQADVLSLQGVAGMAAVTTGDTPGYLGAKIIPADSSITITQVDTPGGKVLKIHANGDALASDRISDGVHTVTADEAYSAVVGIAALEAAVAAPSGLATLDGTGLLAQHVPWAHIDNVPPTMAPSSHASTHASNGSDPLTPSAIGAEPYLANPNDPTRYYRGDKTWQPLTPSAVGLGNVSNAAQLTASQLSTDTALGGASPSNTLVPSQAAAKAYSDALIAANNAMVYRGALDCSGSPLYPAGQVGHTYLCSAAGKIGGGSGVAVENGDMIVCVVANVGGTQAQVGVDWNVIQVNLNGVVIGPASSTDDTLAVFDGSTGKLIKGGPSATSPTFSALTVTGLTGLWYGNNGSATAATVDTSGLLFNAGTLSNTDKGSTAVTAHLSSYDHALIPTQLLNPTSSPTLAGMTITGMTGIVKASGGVFAGGAAHGDLASVGANDHHNQAHALLGTDHTASGLTAGQFLRALSPTTFGFTTAAASAVSNDSSVTGSTVKDALNTLQGALVGAGSYAGNALVNGGFDVGQLLRLAYPGTISTSAGTAITGAGTDLVAQDVNGWIKLSSTWYPIAAVSSTTAATSIGLPSVTNVAYEIARGSADAAYAWDQWYSLVQTAAVGVQRVTGPTNAIYAGRTVQMQSGAQRFGIAQPVESVHTYPLRGGSTVFQGQVRCSASTTIRYAILAWTGTADAPTKDVVNDWTSNSYAAGGFFLGSGYTVVAVGSTAVTANTWTAFSVTGAMASDANNAIVMVWTEGTQAQGVTLDITMCDLFAGTATRTWSPRDAACEVEMCRRYLRVYGGIYSVQILATGFADSATVWRYGNPDFGLSMRILPSSNVSAANHFQLAQGATIIDCTDLIYSTQVYLRALVASGLTTGGLYNLVTKSLSARLILSAQMGV